MGETTEGARIVTWSPLVQERLSVAPWQGEKNIVSPPLAQLCSLARHPWVLGSGAAVLLASGCGEGRTDAQLTGYRTIQPDTLVVELDSCNHDPVLTHLEETATEVRVSVRRDHMVGWFGQSSCLDVVDVELEEPLGTRDLVDASTGATVRRRDG